MRSILSLWVLVVSFCAWAGNCAASPTIPFTQECQVGDIAVENTTALTNVVAALQARKQIKILAIGTSSSVRRGMKLGGHTEETKKILQGAFQGLDVVLIDRGVGGELSAQAVERIQNEVALSKPDLVLWQVGTDDAMAYVPIEELKTTIVDTLRWLRAHKVDVVLVGLQFIQGMEGNKNYRAVRELLKNIADAENVMIVQRYESLRLLEGKPGSAVGLSDQFERSETAYLCLAQYLARAIAIGISGAKSAPNDVRPSVESSQPK